MSIQAIAWVLEYSMSELGDRLVLMAIANHADAHGRNAWPSVEQISKEARVGRSTVFRCLARLVDLGELEIISGGRGPGSTNHYRLPMKGSQNGTLKGSQIETEGSQIETKRVPNRDKKGPTCEPQTVLNRPEPSRARTREVPADHLTLVTKPLTPDEKQRGLDAVARLRESLGR